MQLSKVSESSQEMDEGLRMGDTGQVKEHFLKDKEEKKRRKRRKREEDSKVEIDEDMVHAKRLALVLVLVLVLEEDVVLFPALAQALVLFMCWGMY